jgi:outer membrane protein TolC
MAFAITLSLFYYLGVRAGHRQAKRLYDAAMAELERSHRELIDGWSYVLDNSQEARTIAANYAKFKAAQEQAERLGPLAGIGGSLPPSAD